MHGSLVTDTCGDAASSSDDTLEPPPMKGCPFLGQDFPQPDINGLVHAFKD
jgi:hypothetical protein